jgi:hypothetical protein
MAKPRVACTILDADLDPNATATQNVRRIESGRLESKIEVDD